MFGLSVFVTVLLIGMIWFRSFQKNLYALMNPPEEVDKMLAVENAPTPSLFGFIWQSVGEVKGLVSGLFTNRPPTPVPEQSTVRDTATDNQQQEKIELESGKVYTLPLSEYKKLRN
ncbi:MAG: hypothetical protein HYX22_01105 [Candidatus Yanofskybacteria bacterium]|nr:hypothetical protein [Candidatus Yanofskybacteria bacterium]